jgi:large subunit ribosomal protein L25
MRISFTFGADLRGAQGKGASRRLRHSGKVPAILYGAHKEAQALILDQQNLLTMIADERFYSSIVRLKIGDSTQEAIIKDVQMHPAKNLVVHIDLQRVMENERIRIRLPIHFKGESISPGVKTEGGVVSHMRADVEVSCLPKDLPEFLELDLSGMHLNDTKFLADIPLPEGVTVPELTQRNAPVVSIHAPRAEEPEPVAEAAAAVPAEGAAPAAPGAPGAAPAAGAAPGAAAAAGDAKKGEEKKDAAAGKKDAAPAKKEGGKK